MPLAPNNAHNSGLVGATMRQDRTSDCPASRHMHFPNRQVKDGTKRRPCDLHYYEPTRNALTSKGSKRVVVAGGEKVKEGKWWRLISVERASRVEVVFDEVIILYL
jgi:hypothetical protein